VNFNQTAFETHRQVVPDGTFDLERLEGLFFLGNKPEALSNSKYREPQPDSEGMIELLEASYSFNATSMFEDTALAAKSVAIRQRFFGELLYSSLINQDSPVIENIVGQQTSIEQRIVVVTPVAITIAVLLVCMSIFMGYMVWATSVRRRPLNLLTDPGAVAGVASFVCDNRSVTKLSGNTPCASRCSPTSDDWRPAALRTRSLIALLCGMASIAVALLVLYVFSDKHQLYRSAFVYQMDVGIFEARVSPVGILATLSAVCVRTIPSPIH
jgi:hypothetical protein